ncbi:MAG: vanadium-dependent haloperoxidase [Gemmatimonadetes bacterium]|nr:vanadium-dependent haloperoxidase [Gemmatimonadota bacterium]
MTRAARLGLVAVAGATLASCGGDAPPADPQLVAQWLRTSLAFARSERIGPPVAARISAYGSLALYEGYASDPSSGLASMAGKLNGYGPLPAAPDHSNPDGAIAAAEAERIVLDSLFRDGFASTRRTIDSLAKAQIDGRSQAGVSKPRRDWGLERGQAIAKTILGWAATDSFFATRGRPWAPKPGRGNWINTATTDQYVPQVLSAQSDMVAPANSGLRMELERASEKWVFTNRPKEARPTTLPAFDPVRPTEPYWGLLRPMTLTNADECAPPPPVPYSEQPGSPFWKQGREFLDSASALTPEKKQIALFWADNPVATGTPGFHWISVVNQMIAKRGLSAPQAAEVFALTSIAIHDAFISTWKEKYRSNVVRPVTYVNRVFDPKWVTLFATPPFPEYPSGHSTLSAAAAKVLGTILGDTIPFVDSTQVDIGHAPRAFASFTAARDEVAISRVYGGIHYFPAVKDGMVQGECVASRVLERLAR